MNKPLSRDAVDVAEDLATVKDIVAAAKARFPDFVFEVARDNVDPFRDAGRPHAVVTGRWTSGGKDRGLRTSVREPAAEDEVDEMKQRIARAAIFNDEMRKRAKR